jgi:GTPase KRas protein
MWLTKDIASLIVSFVSDVKTLRSLTLVDKMFHELAASSTAWDSFFVSPQKVFFSSKRETFLIQRAFSKLHVPGELHPFSVGLFGDWGVGKSSLTTRFVGNHFSEETDPTIEDSYKKQVNLYFHKSDSPVSILFDLIDTAGAEGEAWKHYLSNTSNSQSDFSAICVVFNVCDWDSLSVAEQILEHVKEFQKDHLCTVILIANKIDLIDQRVIGTKAGISLARKFDCDYVESSAKMPQMVEETFEHLWWKYQQRKLGGRVGTEEKKCSVQ